MLKKYMAVIIRSVTIHLYISIDLLSIYWFVINLYICHRCYSISDGFVWMTGVCNWKVILCKYVRICDTYQNRRSAHFKQSQQLSIVSVDDKCFKLYEPTFTGCGSARKSNLSCWQEAPPRDFQSNPTGSHPSTYSSEACLPIYMKDRKSFKHCQRHNGPRALIP